TSEADCETVRTLSGLVPLCVEGCGDLTAGAPSATQFDDASHRLLLGLGRPDPTSRASPLPGAA
ncbi:MAG: hypothetical protein ABSC31_16540, partial [Acidimicrobiales bacterium]